MNQATDFFMETHKVEVSLDKSGRGSVTLDGRPIATTYLKVESRAGEGTAKVTLGLVAEVSLRAEVAEGELQFRIEDVVIAGGEK